MRRLVAATVLAATAVLASARKRPIVKLELG
jgi:hypothetical protein